jgi:excisionase family DNA binding protein
LVAQHTIKQAKAKWLHSTGESAAKLCNASLSKITLLGKQTTTAGRKTDGWFSISRIGRILYGLFQETKITMIHRLRDERNRLIPAENIAYHDELTVAQAAEETGLSHDAIYKRIRRGGLPAERRMGAYFIKRKDFEISYMKACGMQ